MDIESTKKIMIVLDSNGRFGFDTSSGITKTEFLGMIELAKEVFLNQFREEPKSKIVIPSLMAPD